MLTHTPHPYSGKTETQFKHLWAGVRV